MTGALLLVLEGLVLCIYGCDVAQGFALLSQPGRWILIVCAAAGGIVALYDAPRIRRTVRPALLTLAAASILVGVIGGLEERGARQIEKTWNDGARDRLEVRARAIEEDFRRFLDELARPIEAIRGSTADRRAAFQALLEARQMSRLPPERQGLAIYRGDGSVLAWEGNNTDAPRALLAATCPGPTFGTGGGGVSHRLYVAVCSPDGLRWVAEFVLDPALDTAARDAAATRLEFLPHWGEVRPALVRFREDTGEQDELARLFQKQGDRHWGVGGGDGGVTLAFPLRAPSGERLAIVSLRDRRTTQEVGEHRRVFRLIAGWSLALASLIACLLPLRAKAGLPTARGALLGSAAIWSVRWSLLVFADPSALPHWPIYDISIYGSSAWGGLLRSPADLLMTSVALCAQVWILQLALARFDGGARALWRRRIYYGALVSTLALLAGAGAALHALFDRLVLDVRLDVSRVETGTLASPRLAIQASLFFLVLALGLMLRGLLDLALRHGTTPTDGRLLRALRGVGSSGIPLALRTTVAILFLTIAYAPILHHSYDRMRRRFFADELQPLVLEQKQMRRQALRDALQAARDPDFAAVAALAAEAPPGSGAAAYRLWRATPVAERGLASSLRIFDKNGTMLSRFAVDFAPTLDAPFDEAEAAATSGVVEGPPHPEMIVRKPVIFGSRWVGGRRLPLLVVFSVSDDYDNLPILSGRTVGTGLLRAAATPRSNPELLRTEPLMAVFSSTHARLYDSGGEIPPPSPDVLAVLASRGSAWTTDTLGGGESLVLYFRGAREIFALAHLRQNRTSLLAGYLRQALLNGLLALLIACFAKAVLWAARPAAPRLSTSATFSERLVAVFLLAGLLPLLTLAFFVTRSTAREIDRDMTATGLASLQVARRVAEDYLTVTHPEEEGSLDDDVVYWLSRVVRQDINVYRDARLMATSARELYSSGLLNERLNGESYRALYLDGEPFWLAEDRTVGLDSLTLSAPMRIDRRGTIGAISIPLIEHRRAAAQKEEEGQDAVLITTCFAVLLLGVVGHAVAQRVSRPVTDLAGAARRVAQGDLDVRVDTTASDETALLVEAFNRMAASLRQQREDLRRRTDYIEKILRSATMGVVSVDGSGTVITVNPAAQSLLAAGGRGLDAGESLPARLERAPDLAPLLAALRRASVGPTEREVEMELSSAPGAAGAAAATRRVRAVFIPFAPEEGRPPGLIVLLEDVTEIVRSGRLAAWAEMARRVAHEIKNPLTPIQLSVEHVRRVFKAKDARFGQVLSECLDNIQKQVEVLRAIAYEFSAYARLPQIRPEPTGVADLLDEALGPYATAAPSGISLRREVAPGLSPVLVDRTVMVRALVNLIENALQAMPEGGTLSLAARGAEASSGHRRIAIEVRDTGCGIPESLLPRLFEPYFSTKSGGTGLGLGLARRAIEEHGGTIVLRSRPGQGTLVTVTLPAAPAGVVVAP